MKNIELKALQKQILKDIEFFIDEKTDTLFARYSVKGHYEVYAANSERFIAHLDSSLRKLSNKFEIADWSESLKVKRQDALIANNKVTVYKRSANDDENLWYFLADMDWSCVHVTKDKWEVTTNYEPVFTKTKNMRAQVVPISKPGTDRMRRYANMSDADYKLFKVNLIHGFFHNSSHYVGIIESEFGTGKTILMRIWRKFLDPAGSEFFFPTSNIEDFKVQLANNNLIMLDNSDKFNAEFSNIISGAVSGTSISKRKLYSDYDEVILKFKNQFVISGIDIVPPRQDLLSRCLLFELKEIPNDKRKTEAEIWANFEKDLPTMLGDIFDTIKKALKILETLGPVPSGRMADATREMLAIALALGIPKDDFYKMLEKNKQRLTLACARNHEIVTAIQNYMESTGKNFIEGDVSSIFNTIYDLNKGISRCFPKSPSAFSRALNQKSQLLLASGIKFALKKTKKATILTLNYNPS